MKKELLFTLMVSCLGTYAQNSRPVHVPTAQRLIVLEDEQNTQNLTTILSDSYGLTSNDALVLSKTETDELSMSHLKHQQFYKGVKVEGATITVHSKDNLIKSLSGYFSPISNLDVNPIVQANDVLNIATSHVNAKKYAWQEKGAHNHGHHNHDNEKPKPEMVILPDPEGFGLPKLAYKIDVYAVEPLYRAHVFVDAKTGVVLKEHHRIHHQDVAATGTSSYNGNVSFTADQSNGVYNLSQIIQGVETYDLNNSTNYSWSSDVTSSTNNFTADPVAVQAHWGAEKTHSYLMTKHNRNSYDGSGTSIKSHVHYSTNYANAFWDGTRMTYGDGDGINVGPMVSLDIVGHEIMHGVTEYSANLVYERESGALNESFSDIFGEAIERFATGSNDWQMGTDIGIGGSGAIRSMSSPNSYGDPDTYGGLNWYTPNCGVPNPANDYCGVHINSGVQNKWFYILCQGETGTNDISNAYSVTGIGMDKAAAIAYRNLTVYLGANSTFADARDGSIQSAVDLYGAGSAEVIATTDAWYAVGVGNVYGLTSYCASQSTSSNYEWISEVTIGTFTHTSGSSKYTDYTGTTINLTPGQTYNIGLTPSFSGNSYNEYWKIWIDYNGNGDFTDAGEEVFDAGAVSKTKVTGSIAIPSSVLGSTRMRVSMKYNAAQTGPCELFSYGEVQDYTVSFGSVQSDTAAPTSPGNLTTSGTTYNSSVLNWNASTDNVGVAGYNVYAGGVQKGTTTGLTFSVTGLTSNSTHSIMVEAFDASGNKCNGSTVVVNTLVAPDTIAPTQPTNLAANNIAITSANVSWLASTDNVGVDGYNVYINGALNGSTTSNIFSLNGLTPGTTYNIGVAAYDAVGNTCTASNVTFTTVSIIDTVAPSTPAFFQPGNTTLSSVNLTWYACTDNVGVTGYNIYVNGVFNKTCTSTASSIPGLTSGTTYSFGVEAFDAAGNISTRSLVTGSTQNTPPSAVLFAHYFESGWDGWTDGGSDVSRYSGSRSYEGNYSILIRDNSGAASTMSSPAYDVSTYTQLDIEFYFYPNSMEAGEDFWLKYYDGTTWKTIATYTRNTDFQNNQFYAANVAINNANYTFPTNAKFALQCDAGSNSDRVYIDQVSVTGSNPTNIIRGIDPVTSITAIETETEYVPSTEDVDLRLYPNPAKDFISIDINEDVSNLAIFTLSGEVLLELDNLDSLERIDISSLAQGTYFIRARTEQEVYTKKFIKL